MLLWILRLECDMITTTNERRKLMYNQDIRQKAERSGVRLWQIAEALGVADCNFSRKLRKELPQEEKEKIFSIIEKLAQEVN